MSTKTLKHFVLVRFFPKQDPKYPHDVFDTDFLSKQLVLAKNMFASLENQTNKNFEIVFVVNAKLVSDKKYEFILSALKESASLPVRFITTKGGAWMFARSELPALFKETFEKYDFVIQSRMDFDDFIYKDAVADTQDKIHECDDVLGYGYCNGYRYILGEMYNMGGYYQGNGHQGIMQSLILKSSFAKNIPFMSIYSFTHSKFKKGLQTFLEKHGVEFSEKMFRQNLDTRAYIYYGHEFSHYFLSHELEFKLPKRKPLTNKQVSKKELEEEFGFFHELKTIK